MKLKTILSLICIGLMFAGCATSVKRVDSEKVIDLSGEWNDTDSRLVSEEMIKDALERPWLKRHIDKRGGSLPVVIVGTVRNRSHEHINVETFTKDLERALINSGEVEFVANRAEDVEVRAERQTQAAHSSKETVKSEGEEVGADFILTGTVNSILDVVKGKAVVFYQVDLELTDIETHKKVWIGDKKIKKYVKRSKLKP